MTTTINNEHKKLNVPNPRFPECSGEWKKCKLGEISNFAKSRINSSQLDEGNYISTENMLQDFQGVVDAKSVPTDINVFSFEEGDILISNIRPYLKKVLSFFQELTLILVNVPKMAPDFNVNLFDFISSVSFGLQYHLVFYALDDMLHQELHHLKFHFLLRLVKRCFLFAHLVD